MTARAEIISFGYLHGPAPEAHLTADVRWHFRDPHVSPALRCLTAHDPEVAAAVLATPGIPALIAALATAAQAFLAGPSGGTVTIAIGCAGGRHRSAVIATEVARHLPDAGIAATLTHRDIARPVIKREEGRLAVRKSQVAKLVKAAKEHDDAANESVRDGDGSATEKFRRAESAWLAAMRNATAEEIATYRKIYE